MNHIKLFSKLLRIRTIFKRTNQLSWTIQKLDSQYKELDNLSAEDQEELLKAYFSLMDEFMNIYESFKNERNNE